MDTQDFLYLPEMDAHHEQVKEHNALVQPALIKFMKKCTDIHPEVYDMGSRGFTWKDPTNYIDSDFEIAVVADPVKQLVLATTFGEMIKSEDCSHEEFVIKAGMIFQVVKDYKFSDKFTQKLEIRYQTPEQNQAIKNSYLKYVTKGEASPKKIAWYSYTMDRASKNDPALYLNMKSWLKVLEERKSNKKFFSETN